MSAGYGLAGIEIDDACIPCNKRILCIVRKDTAYGKLEFLICPVVYGDLIADLITIVIRERFVDEHLAIFKLDGS